jgi:NNP family nitrate/nitrite transporter-like MFS transporter
LHLTQAEVANSNILALVATLIVRLIVGPLCDRFGPRYVFAGILIAGALPSVLAGTVTSAAGLMVLRFFVGILGASFVPCQVWSTGFFDKSVIGTSNALMAGIGNAGGGITYFVMPAIFDSLVKKQGLVPHKAWRVAFIVPFILITATALGMIFLCDDTPTGMYLSVLTGDTSDILSQVHGASVTSTPNRPHTRPLSRGES